MSKKKKEVINRIKEGYKIGDKVCIVSQRGLYNISESILEGEVTYVGTKNINVEIYDSKKKVITFKSSNTILGGFNDPTYFLFKSNKEYDQYVEDNKERDKLTKYIKDNLKVVDLEDLRKIADIIKNN